MKTDLLITNCMLLPDPGRAPLIEQGFVAIAGTRITQVGALTDRLRLPEATTVIDGRGQLAMPGLVNGHCHAPMTLFRGLADDLDLATWLTQHIFPAEARRVNPEMVYWCTKLAAAEMLLSGTTTVADGYFFEHEVARACAETGIRCLAAQAVIDFPAPGVEDPGRNIEVASRFLEQWQDRHPLIQPALFAHAPYSCGNSTLRRAKALARAHGVPLFLHAAETARESSQIAEPLGATPIAHLAALDLLDPNTICVHCVWASDSDLELLATHDAAVVSCPQSNAKLASGRAPLTTMRKRGLRVALGTDSAASNNSLDLFRELDFAAKVHKVNPVDPTAMPATELLHLATAGGAAALGQAAGLGTLAPGTLADLVLIDLQKPQLQPFHNPQTLIYSNAGAAVRSVVVHGQLVVHDRIMTTIDLKETCTRIRALATA